METVCSSEMSVNFYHNTLTRIPEYVTSISQNTRNLQSQIFSYQEFIDVTEELTDIQAEAVRSFETSVHVYKYIRGNFLQKR
jgi:hypothetical protein